MTKATSRSKKERLEARITAEQKELIERAAALTGRSLTDFVLSSLQIAAEETIRSHEVLSLTARDSRLFAQAVLSPAAPNEHLTALAREYRDVTDS